jgi:hypothetical protein
LGLQARAAPDETRADALAVAGYGTADDGGGFVVFHFAAVGAEVHEEALRSVAAVGVADRKLALAGEVGRADGDITVGVHLDLRGRRARNYRRCQQQEKREGERGARYREGGGKLGHRIGSGLG